MIYIIGVDHLIQYRNSIVPLPVYDRFMEYIREIIAGYEIELIAEEFNSEYLKDLYSTDRGTLESCSLTLGVNHLYCDPGKEEREELGIPSYADIREGVIADWGLKKNYISDLELTRRVEDETAGRSKKYWERRERFWLSRIREREEKRVLFVCGHEHVERFRKLPGVHSIESVIVNDFWEKELFSDYQNFGLD